MKVDAKLDKKMAELDFANAKPVHEVPALARRQAKQSSVQRQLLANDVQQWLLHQDDATIDHINAVIRHFMAVKMA